LFGGLQLLRGRLAQERAGLLVRAQQLLDPLPQCGLAGAGAVEVGNPRGRLFALQGIEEDRALVHDAPFLPDRSSRPPATR
jgi:hypothetical protein